MIIILLLGVALWCYGVWDYHPFAVGMGFALIGGSVAITILYDADNPKENR